MTRKRSAARWLKSGAFRKLALTGVWVVLLVAVVLPTWNKVIRQNSEIQAMEDDLATLNDWTVAGMWLSQSVARRAVPITMEFHRLFPPRRAREKFFLDLARVADESGVGDFSLSEVNGLGMASNDVWSDGTGMAGSEEPPPPSDATAAPGALESAMTLEIPPVELSSYRVKAHFNGDYQRIAGFMGGLKKIKRAVKVHSLVIQPKEDVIGVDLELDVYVSEQS